MGDRRLRPGTMAVGLIILATIGCSSSEEEPPLDPGVSPFYPGPAESAKVSARPGSPRDEADRRGSSTADVSGPEAEAPLGPRDVERQLRIALIAAERGDAAKAARTMDRILAIEPLNREALLGRAFLALQISEKAKTEGDRAAAVEKATELARTLQRAYEKPTKREVELYARVFDARARLLAAQGHFDRAAAVLKEAYDGGINLIEQAESEPEAAMVKFRASPEYRTLLKNIDETNLAAARALVKDHLAKPLDFAFDFKVNDIDGKPLALDQLRGKVVIVNIWGTWCKPCRESIPGLVQLYRLYHRRGLEIVGLAYEPGAPSPEKAVQMVKKFVKETGVPYLCALGDEATLKKIPDFHAYPTTLVVDRRGKVRMLVTENTQGVLGMLHAVAQVLLAEPSTGPVTPAMPPTAANKK